MDLVLYFIYTHIDKRLLRSMKTCICQVSFDLYLYMFSLYLTNTVMKTWITFDNMIGVNI